MHVGKESSLVVVHPGVRLVGRKGGHVLLSKLAETLYVLRAWTASPLAAGPAEVRAPFLLSASKA